MAATNDSISSVLSEILASVKALQVENHVLASRVDEINGKVNVLSSLKQVHEVASSSKQASSQTLIIRNSTVSRYGKSSSFRYFEWLREHAPENARCQRKESS
jgi:hypothetical protein